MSAHKLVSIGLVALGVSLLVMMLFEVDLGAVSIIKHQPLQLAPISEFPVVPVSPSEQQSFVDGLTATSLYVKDVQSGSTLLQKNPDQVVYPASTVKMMTALVALDQYQLDQTLKVSRQAFSNGSSLGLGLGQEFTVSSLLRALLIPSANDAAFVLADSHPLGYDGFVVNMNAKAHELGMNHTTFTNPSGLDDPTQQTTVRDMTILATQLVKDGYLKEVVGLKNDIITDVTGVHRYPLYTTNQLLGRFDVVGIKTGTTELANEALITLMEKDGHQLIVTLLNSQDRYTDTTRVLTWIEDQMVWQNFAAEADREN